MYSALRTQVRHVVAKNRHKQYDKTLKSWLERIQAPEVSLNGDSFVFNTVRSSRLNLHLFTDLYLGHMIARNGGVAHILLDDGILQLWDTVQVNRMKGKQFNIMRSPADRQRIKQDLSRLFEVFALPNLHLHWYSDFLPAEINEELSEFEERFAIASTVRYFEEGMLDLENPDQHRYHQLSRENAKVSKAVGRHVVEVMKPDIYATSHGIYSTWGPAYWFIKDAGIQTRVYSKHAFKLGGMIFKCGTANSFDRDDLERYLDDAQFTDEQRDVAKEYLDSRFNHRAVDTKVYFGDTFDKHADQSTRYQASDYGITFGLFPNVVWDAIGWENEGAYGNVIDWIVDTARIIGEQGKHRLVIRYHPSEATMMRGSTPSHKHITAALPEIEKYPNIEIIQAEEPVNSYNLIRDSIDVTLVYTTSFGAEAQVLGRPVVAVASGRFSDRHVHRVKSAAEYHKALENPQALIADFEEKRDQIVDDIYKYHYYVNEVMYCPLGVMGDSNPTRIAFQEELRGDRFLDQRSVEKALRYLDLKH